MVLWYRFPVREKPRLLRPKARMNGPTGIGMAARMHPAGRHIMSVMKTNTVS